MPSELSQQGSVWVWICNIDVHSKKVQEKVVSRAYSRSATNTVDENCPRPSNLTTLYRPKFRRSPGYAGKKPKVSAALRFSSSAIDDMMLWKKRKLELVSRSQTIFRCLF